jgi:hypothetical protein
MRRLAAITFGAVLAFALLGLPSQARADTISSASQYFFVGDGVTSELKLTNYESAFTNAWSSDPSTWTAVDVAGGASIAEGDYLRGIFTITSSNSVPSSTQRNPDTHIFELTGVFSAQISRLYDLGGGRALFELTPDSGFEKAFVPGAMTAFFEDTSPDFTEVGSLSDSYNSAADGSLFAVLGAPSGGTWGTDYYWAAVGTATADTGGDNLGVSLFAASLALLENHTGYPSSAFVVLPQTPPSNTSTTVFFDDQTTLGSILNEFALQGNTKANTVSGSPWEIKSQDPLDAIVVPVPAASWLGGVMLLGMLGFGIRKSRRREAC